MVGAKFVRADLHLFDEREEGRGDEDVVDGGLLGRAIGERYFTCEHALALGVVIEDVQSHPVGAGSCAEEATGRVREGVPVAPCMRVEVPGDNNVADVFELGDPCFDFVPGLGVEFCL